MEKKRYSLITSAYNEEKNIDKTITSVIEQTLLPSKWIIINDGSTDKTGEIIKSLVEKYKFIEYIERTDSDKTHSFNSKVQALNIGLEKINWEKTDFIGILDADLSFEKNYYETIINIFNKNELLGIAGGNIIEYLNNKKRIRIKTFNSVAGGVQLFRTECFKETGGFKPFQYGGEDAALEINARMNGWKVKTFSDIEVLHYGPVGGASKKPMRSRYKRGAMYYTLGYHPFFHIIRCLYRIIERPYFIGSIAELTGFFIKLFSSEMIILQPEAVKYLRVEQIDRIKRTLSFLIKK